MASVVDIWNLALRRIGQSRTIVTEGEGTAEAQLLTIVYPTTRDTALRAFPWTWAQRQARGITLDLPVATITGATQADPVVITAANSFLEGDRVDIADVVGMTQLNGNEYVVQNPTGAQFELSGVDGTAFTAYSSGGTATGNVPTGWEYQYQYPADCLRMLKLVPAVRGAGVPVPFRIMRHDANTKKIVTDQEDAEFEYISQVTDSTLFDPTFVHALSWLLASEIALPLTKSRRVREETLAIYQSVLTAAWSSDLNESVPDVLRDSESITVRM